MSPSSLCLSSKWLCRAVGTSKLSRQRGQMKPSCGEFPFSPFSAARVGESVTDFAFSAMFFRKFIFLGNQPVIPGLRVRWGSAPSVFHFHRKMTEEGVAAAEAGRWTISCESCAGQYNAEQPQQVHTKPHAIGIRKSLKAVCK